ncbi:MAG: preprotein translocase subunit YajC [Omnitrophica WOR_2 bacterium GWB2_45_9]|nr:MAG: preprotein translocase subunit YajC [Omnitrophica WOR_2 bacterium GWB2_45_9]OGX52832.1 MAG: preprotein translocase subunit YajC [Omnitrophica WOR_2 bacterium RIFOXYB2_FULL_45_11]HBU08319.1 preprotein translocase subunit YajC [Candidatus Omnitrophota bacterium]
MQPQAVNPILQMFPLLLVFIIFYFMLIRPQQKKEKERLNMLKNIKKNDEVVTSGGIHAVVLNVKDRTATLRVDDNVKIEVDKDAIARVEKVS